MKHILVVDDSSTIRKLVASLLKANNITIYEAEGGVEALELAKKHRFDLMISDCHMPEMNGLELVKELRQIERYKKLPILMLTTESDPKMRQEGKELGLLGWALKPLNQQMFKHTIDRVLSKFESA